jgi:hypothetical protein
MTNINTSERNRFWTVIAGMWAFGSAALTVLANVLFRRK